MVRTVIYQDNRYFRECKVFSASEIAQQIPLDVRLAFENEKALVEGVTGVLNEFADRGSIEVVQMQGNRRRWRYVRPEERKTPTSPGPKGRRPRGGRHVPGTSRRQKLPKGDIGKLVKAAKAQGAEVRMSGGHFFVKNPQTGVEIKCSGNSGTKVVAVPEVRADLKNRLGYDV